MDFKLSFIFLLVSCAAFAEHGDDVSLVKRSTSLFDGIDVPLILNKLLENLDSKFNSMNSVLEDNIRQNSVKLNVIKTPVEDNIDAKLNVIKTAVEDNSNKLRDVDFIKTTVEENSNKLSDFQKEQEEFRSKVVSSVVPEFIQVKLPSPPLTPSKYSSACAAQGAYPAYMKTNVEFDLMRRDTQPVVDALPSGWSHSFPIPLFHAEMRWGDGGPTLASDHHLRKTITKEGDGGDCWMVKRNHDNSYDLASYDCSRTFRITCRYTDVSL